MTAPEQHRRKPWLACLLNAAGPGVGFLYLARPRLTAVMLVVPLAAIAFTAWTRLVFVPLAALGAIVVMLGVWAVSMVSAFIIARRQDAVPPRWYQRWYCYLGYVVLVSVAYDVILQFRGAIFGYETFRFPSASMEETMKAGDLFMSDTWTYRRRDPQRGELAIFLFPRDPSLKYVKRVIGVPGDTVLVRAGEVRVNGAVVNEPYVNPANDRGENVPASGAVHVPAGQYYVLGDNRDNSADSRNWGLVPRENFYGNVEYIWYSRDLERVGLRPK